MQETRQAFGTEAEGTEQSRLIVFIDPGSRPQTTACLDHLITDLGRPVWTRRRQLNTRAALNYGGNITASLTHHHSSVAFLWRALLAVVVALT